jgi:hypothetical protein
MYRTFESRGFQSPQDENIVEDIKQQAAELEDTILKLLPINDVPTQESNRCIATARTHLENAVMWAVKGASRK